MIVDRLVKSKILHLRSYPQNLYQLLSCLPRDGVGARVYPAEWAEFNPKLNSYYTITHVRLTPGMTQGIVSGFKIVDGERVGELPRPISQELAAKVWKTL